MRQGAIYKQIAGWRYTYETPRGTIAIDELDDGSREVIRCSSDVTRRDIREAIAMHNAIISESEEEN